MLVVFFFFISSFFVIQLEMTDIFNEITAALSNRNTTTNAIIWTNAKASWSEKRDPVVVVIQYGRYSAD